VARRLFGEFAGVRGGEWRLYLSQGGDGVAYAVGELFDGQDSSARGVAQFLAQEKLRLTDESRERVVYLVSHARGEFRDLRQPRLSLRDSAPQLLLLALRRAAALRAWFTLTHRQNAPSERSLAAAHETPQRAPL
jgi:hypothetical protein